MSQMNFVEVNCPSTAKRVTKPHVSENEEEHTGNVILFQSVHAHENASDSLQKDREEIVASVFWRDHDRVSRASNVPVWRNPRPCVQVRHLGATVHRYNDREAMQMIVTEPHMYFVIVVVVGGDGGVCFG